MLKKIYNFFVENIVFLSCLPQFSKDRSHELQVFNIAEIKEGKISVKDGVKLSLHDLII